MSGTRTRLTISRTSRSPWIFRRPIRTSSSTVSPSAPTARMPPAVSRKRPDRKSLPITLSLSRSTTRCSAALRQFPSRSRTISQPVPIRSMCRMPRRPPLTVRWSNRLSPRRSMTAPSRWLPTRLDRLRKSSCRALTCRMSPSTFPSSGVKSSRTLSPVTSRSRMAA